MELDADKRTISAQQYRKLISIKLTLAKYFKQTSTKQAPSLTIDGLKSFANQITTLTKVAPQLAIAASLCRWNKPSEVDDCLSAALLTAYMGFSSHWNQLYTQQVISALLSIYWIKRQYDLDPKEQRLYARDLATELSQKHLEVWRSTFQIWPYCQHKNLLSAIKHKTFTPSQLTVLHADFLTTQTPDDFASRLAQCVQATSFSAQSSLDALCLITSTVRAGSVFLYQSEKTVCIANDGKELLGAALSAPDKPIWLSVDNVSGVPAKPITFEQWWSRASSLYSDDDVYTRTNQHFARDFNINHPPQALTSLLSHLKNPDVTVDKIVQLVESEPFFSDYIKGVASQDNRMQLPVSNVKQGVMTYGLERVGDMLVQQALQKRLTQHYFPLVDTCRQLTMLITGIAALLAQESKVSTPQQAGLLATVACSPLFTVPALKVLLKFHHQSTHYYSLNSLLNFSSKDQITEFAKQLTNKWYLPDYFNTVLSLQGKLPKQVPNQIRKPFALLGCSVYLGRKWLLGFNKQCLESEQFYTQSLEVLNINHVYLKQIKSQLNHLVVYPVQY